MHFGSEARDKMGKKRNKNAQDWLNDFDPAIEKLAQERLFSGKQLFDYRTHRLRRSIRDEGQARAVLIRAEALAKQLDKKLVLRYFEKRLLKRVFVTFGEAGQ